MLRESVIINVLYYVVRVLIVAFQSLLDITNFLILNNVFYFHKEKRTCYTDIRYGCALVINW